LLVGAYKHIVKTLMRDLARIFSALADLTRLEMLALLLRHEELCVCDFEGALEISQSRASRHLRYLRNAGLLEDRPQGLWVYYRISPELGAERRKILGMLRSVFDGRDLRSMHERYEAWVARKELRCSSGPGRAAGKVDKARARSTTTAPTAPRLRKRGPEDAQPRRPAARP
jgi:ArsR family transcriptional regulator, arsenate/arsenite/antimonite-responsive transcriptional repressor